MHEFHAKGLSLQTGVSSLFEVPIKLPPFRSNARRKSLSPADAEQVNSRATDAEST